MESPIQKITSKINELEGSIGALSHAAWEINDKFEGLINVAFPLGLSSKEKAIAKLVLRSKFNEMLDNLRR